MARSANGHHAVNTRPASFTPEHKDEAHRAQALSHEIEKPLQLNSRAAVTPGSIFRRFERPSAERRFCGSVIALYAYL